MLPDTREEHLRAFAAGPGVPLPALPGTGGSSTVGGDDDSTGSGGSGGLRILVCTDLASRGLDLGIVDHVVQFDFALNVVSFCMPSGTSIARGDLFRALIFLCISIFRCL